MGTVLKRSALDLWDNGPVLFAGNFLLIATGFGLYLMVIAAARFGLGSAFVGIAAATLAASWLLCFAAFLVDALLMHRSFDGRLWRDGARRSFVPAALWAATSLCLASVLMLAVPEAAALPGGAGVAATAFLSWTGLVWLQASLFFFPVLAMENGDVVAGIRATCLLVFGNPGFSLLVTTMAALFFLFGLFVVPGPAGALILLHRAARLRLCRYEDRPVGRDEAPDWHCLLAKERDGLARRSLRSVVFPWKL